MTPDEARQRAVEAAAREWLGAAFDDASEECRVDWLREMAAAIAAYEAAMAEAGWRMVREDRRNYIQAEPADAATTGTAVLGEMQITPRGKGRITLPAGPGSEP